MNNFYTVFLLLFSTAIFAQIPANYYDSANGLTGFALKTELRDIVATGHIDRGYAALFPAYAITDMDDTNQYDNDGYILDMYSENPNGPDPYNYTYGTDQCGNYNAEGVCYNREHLVPQSSFNQNYPMRSDIHHIFPVDGKVNGNRQTFPFGKVGTATIISQNGSKIGNSAMPGYSGIVFEPIDEFKGDIARAVLYFAVRYENTIHDYTSFDMFNGTNDQVFFPWAIDILLEWHNNDLPTPKEIARNKAAYTYQGNANPFVDHPEYANLIWNPNPDTEAPTNPTNLVASNPTDNSIQLTWTASTDNIGVTSYDVYVNAVYSFNTTSTSANATGLTANTNYCFTVKAKDAGGNQSGFSNQACETTTDNGTVAGGDCAEESFSNIGTPSGSYSTVTWTGDNGLTWTAIKARTDETIVDEAITIDARSGKGGKLTSPAVNGGIGDLTVTTQRKFGGSTGNLDLSVNGNVVGQIPYDTAPITTTITDIKIEGTITIEISGDAADRVAIDDLSWTCFVSVSVEDFELNQISIHPNPVENQLNIQLKNSKQTQIDIFNILGKRVFSQTIQQSQSIQLDKLQSGIYLMTLTQGNATITKKLIKK